MKGARSKSANDDVLSPDNGSVDVAQVKRPSLGSLFWAAVLSWVAAIAAEHLCWSRYVSRIAAETASASSEPRLVILVLVGFACLAVLLWRRAHRDLCVSDTLQAKKDGKKRRGEGAWSGICRLLLLLLPAGAVFACSVLYWNAWEQDVAWLSQVANEQVLEVELVGDPAQRDYGLVSVGRVSRGTRNASVRVIWPQGSAGECAGHAVEVTGSYKTPSSDEAGRWNHRQGLLGSIKVSEYSSYGYASGLRGAVTPLRDLSMERIGKLDSAASSLLAGVLIGDKTTYAGSELEQDFKTTGLAHLMAVSGTHLAVVTLLVGWVLARLPISRVVRAVFTFLLLLGYVALTAFSPSALRALVMCTIGLSAFALHRRRHLISSLAICVVFFLGFDPSAAFSLGLALSVLCMVGILVFTPLASAWIRQLLPRRAQDMADVIAATLASSLATLPVCVPMFAQLPLISPFSTMLVSPFVTLIVGLGVPALLLGGSLSFAGDLLLAAAGLIASLCAKLVHALADIPFACLPLDSQAAILGVACALGALAIWAVWPLPKARAGKLSGRIAALCGVVAPLAAVVVIGFGGGAQNISAVAHAPSQEAPQVVMLDVGQGDSMLVRDGKAAVLIDTGEEGAVLLKALARHGISRLDAVLLSHKDVDHTGALSALAGVVDVGHVYIHADLLNASSCEKVHQAASWASRHGTAEGVRPGDVIRVGRFSLTLLGPESGGDGENDDSLIWLLEFGGADGSTQAKGLLTGDGEEQAIAAVLEAAGDVDFLKVGHHGSADAVSDDEMKALKPELSLISVGADNDYGHPTRQTLGVLERAGSRILRTDLSGDIALLFEDGQMAVSCQR